MWALGLSIIFIFWALEAGAVKMKKDKPRRLTLKQQMEKFRKKMSIPGYRAPWLVNRSVQDQGHVSSSPVFGPRGLLSKHVVAPPSRPSLGIVHVFSSSDEDPDPFGVFYTRILPVQQVLAMRQVQMVSYQANPYHQALMISRRATLCLNFIVRRRIAWLPHSSTHHLAKAFTEHHTMRQHQVRQHQANHVDHFK